MAKKRMGVAGVLLAAVAVLIAVLAPSGSAGAAESLTLQRGSTSVTASPAITSTLLRNGILPLPVGGATEVPVLTPGGLAVKGTFAVTGGTVDAETLAGSITHSGGLIFVNLPKFKTVTVSDFTIVIDGSPHLVATKVNGAAASLRVFELDLSKAKINKSAKGVTVSGIGVTFTADAAAALNSTLGTSIFSAGLVAGTAETRVVPAPAAG